MTRYRCVDSQKSEGFPVTAACAAAGVSTSGYYDWANRQDRPPTPTEVDEAALVERIKALFDASDGTYGVPRMCRALRNEDLNVNRKRVTRLMRRHGLAGRAFRRRVRTTIPTGEEFFIPDLVGRAFAPGPTDAAWCQDITYIPTGEGWLYMASVLDIGSRRLVGYAMADHMRTELVTDALTAAINTRGGAVTDVIAHADRGTQYTSHEYLTFCANNGLRPSVGRTGVCYDNAVAESFWASLKRECLHTKPTFATRADARRAIMRWVHWYNTGRIHTTLGGIPPVEWEHQYDQDSQAA